MAGNSKCRDCWQYSTANYFGDYNGDGRSELLFLRSGAGNNHWFLGTINNNQLTCNEITGNGVGFADLRDTLRFQGGFSRPDRNEILFYYPGDHNWWLGTYDGNQFNWKLVSNTTGFGDTSKLPHFVGRFSRNDRDEIMFYFAGDGNWWLGTHDGNQIRWNLASNTTGFGNIINLRKWIGDFNGDGRSDVLFYFAGDGHWWLGPYDGNKIQWTLVAEDLLPQISSLIPTSGQIGDAVTIKGDNFTGVQQVLFGNKASNFTVNSQTTITSTIPQNATPGTYNISVVTSFGKATSTVAFTVVQTPPPTINNFTPTAGAVGTGVKINGSNFSRATAVQFNGVNANFTIGSDAAITTTVPANATDGPITVTNPGGSATSNNNFDVQPTVLPSNLAFRKTWMDPTEFPTPGQPFAVYFSFYNGDGTATGKFTIRLQLDNGAKLLDVAAPSYAPGATDFVYWPFPEGLPAGEHFFYAYLDIFNQVVEVSESDNTSYHGFRVA